MLYAGLDLSRKRVDVCLLDEHGTRLEMTAAPPDGDGLRGLADRLAGRGQPIYAALESMNGARFVHDTLEEEGWTVAVADACKVRGLAPLGLLHRYRLQPPRRSGVWGHTLAEGGPFPGGLTRLRC